jgi:hypothetical protein
VKLRVNGKVWNLEFQPTPCVEDEKCLGFCERPDKKNKKIVIKESLRGEKLLEILIHEQLHAALWVADEEWVQEVGVDLARNIRRVMEAMPEKFDGLLGESDG